MVSRLRCLAAAARRCCQEAQAGARYLCRIFPRAAAACALRTGPSSVASCQACTAGICEPSHGWGVHRLAQQVMYQM